MKKIVILGIVITMLFGLCGCTTTIEEEKGNVIDTGTSEIKGKGFLIDDGQGNVVDIGTGEIKEKRFITVYTQGKFYIIADKETGVQYLVFQDIQEGGMTVLVDENGKPLLYEENFEE